MKKSIILLVSILGAIFMYGFMNEDLVATIASVVGILAVLAHY